MSFVARDICIFMHFNFREINKACVFGFVLFFVLVDSWFLRFVCCLILAFSVLQAVGTQRWDWPMNRWGSSSTHPTRPAERSSRSLPLQVRKLHGLLSSSLLLTANDETICSCYTFLISVYWITSLDLMHFAIFCRLQYTERQQNLADCNTLKADSVSLACRL